jgi:hypothetical protein
VTALCSADLAGLQSRIGDWLAALRRCHEELRALRASLPVSPEDKEICEMGESRPWDLATWIAAALDCTVEESLSTAIEYLASAAAETQERLDQDWRETHRSRAGGARHGSRPPILEELPWLP